MVDVTSEAVVGFLFGLGASPLAADMPLLHLDRTLQANTSEQFLGQRGMNSMSLVF